MIIVLAKFEKFMLSYGLYIAVAVLIFAVGFTAGRYTTPEQEVTTVEKPVYITEQAETKTITKIAYVPKEVVVEKHIDANTNKEIDTAVVEKTDLDANIGKQDFNVKVNGEEITFNKTDDEQYVFDKNKIVLEQTSMVNFDIKVPTVVIDKTNRWAIGIGKAPGSGAAYTIDFPIGKSNTFGGWAYKDDDNEAVGIKIKF